jgi:hypothetical protein
LVQSVVVRLASDKLAAYAALLIAALALAFTVRFNTYVAWGTDSSAYLDAAVQWAAGELFHPAHFRFWAPWDADGTTEAPFGRTPGAVPGTIVSVYPPGYALLLAPAVALGGALAAHLVAPFFLAVLAWCAYRLTSFVATPWAGVAASVLVATTPVAVAHVLMPMSDVPAAALWALGWWMALRPGYGAALASGTSVAMATLVRPNLAPIAVVILGVVIAADRRSRWSWWGRACAFSSAAAIGPAILLWSQDVLYGSPFSTGYRAADTFFRMDRIPMNAAHYPRMLIELYGWPVLAGLALVPFAFQLRRRDRSPATPAIVVIAAAAVVLVNYAVLLPYLTFQGWYWLRFLLPALLSLFILLAAALDHLRLLIAARAPLLQVIAIVPLVLVLRAPRHEFRATFDNLAGHQRVSMMGMYLRDALPRNAVILTYLQSGAAAFYTGLPVVRLDPLGPDLLDRVVDDLNAAGYHPVLVIDEAMEAASFRERYIGSRYQHLDWPARAEFWSGTPMLYLDPADRERHLNGERYPTDMLALPVGHAYPPSGPSLAPPQGLAMPRTHEARAFRATLDAFYRDRLARPAATTHVPPADAVQYTLRYLRYRVYGCAHDDSVGRVFAQIDRHDVAPVCGRIRSIELPPWDQVVDFRRRLETKYRDERRMPALATHVDLEGDGIWTQEYLRYRLAGCAAADATARVLDQIGGKAVPPCPAAADAP